MQTFDTSNPLCRLLHSGPGRDPLRREGQTHTHILNKKQSRASKAPQTITTFHHITQNVGVLWLGKGSAVQYAIGPFIPLTFFIGKVGRVDYKEGELFTERDKANDMV